MGTRTVIMLTHQVGFQGPGEAAPFQLAHMPPLTALSPHSLSTHCAFGPWVRCGVAS